MKWAIGFVMAVDDRIPRKPPWGWKAIRWFQGYTHYPLGAAVHCFLTFEINGSWQVYETSDTGYRTSTLISRSSGTPLDIFYMPNDGRPAYNHAVDLLKKKTRYGFIDIANFGPILLAERAVNLPRQIAQKPYRPFPPLPNFWAQDSNVYCTESTLDAMVKTGIKSPWPDKHAGVRCPHLYKLFTDIGFDMRRTSGETITKL